MALMDWQKSQWLPTQQNPNAGRDKFLYFLRLPELLGTELEKESQAHLLDETPQSQQLQVSRWLKVRCEHLLSCSSDLEAECLIEEFDDVEYS